MLIVLCKLLLLFYLFFTFFTFFLHFLHLFYTSTSVIGNASSMCGDVTNGAHVARYWLPPMGPTRSCPLPNL